MCKFNQDKSRRNCKNFVNFKIYFDFSRPKQTCLLFYQSCKKYGQTVARNELFNWLLINFSCLIADTKMSEAQLDSVDKELLLNLLTSESFVVSSEYNLYAFLKKWILHDLMRQDKLRFYDSDGKDSAFLSSMLGLQYQGIFDNIRLPCLLAYSKTVTKVLKDNLFSHDVLHQTMFEIHSRILKAPDPSVQDRKTHFRFAKRILMKKDFDFTNEFFFAGVSLLFKFNSRRLAVERLPPSHGQALSVLYHGLITTQMSFTLYGSSGRDQTRFTSEATPTTIFDLAIGKERTIHNWRKTVTFPCILAANVQISLGNTTVEID